MTDAEKELRRLCVTLNHEGSSEREKTKAGRELASRLGPAAVLALLDRIDALEGRVSMLQSKGGMLANAAYNLKQMDYLPEQHRDSLDRAQRAWDEAVRTP